MNKSDEILNIAKKNNGIITSSIITEAGLSRGLLKYLTDIGKLERAARGVYVLTGTMDDEFVNLQSRFKKGVFCLETALFLNDLTDRTPNKYNMAFPYSYNLDGAKKSGVLCSSSTKENYGLGVIKIATPSGNLVSAYNAERTLCDILKTKSKTDIQLVSTAFKRYVKRKDKNIPLLSEYAKILKIEKKLRTYLEVLL
ncbi:MAG: type IV toxin-antitoxin system AbiEi family antitoxin domain-containing protein [Clostridia bacterium]|nr:type IV toxin-antitoxin system AbiEi family antitoxin domain-containing protein [Clostridia bacterium]